MWRRNEEKSQRWIFAVSVRIHQFEHGPWGTGKQQVRYNNLEVENSEKQTEEKPDEVDISQNLIAKNSKGGYHTPQDLHTEV
jgi:hypothetical protein